VPTEPLLSVLRTLECELHEPRVRRDPARLDELLHPSFGEFGRSGNAYTKTEIVALLLNEQEAVQVHAEDFRVLELAEGVALLTYKSAHLTVGGALERQSLRSSIWKLGGSGWQLLFHQGTATTDFAQNAA
jgi:hypothetical protein